MCMPSPITMQDGLENGEDTEETSIKGAAMGMTPL